jgi:hypothetical protein
MRQVFGALIGILFWLIQLWWLGSVLSGLRSTAGGGTFRVLSVRVGDEFHDGWGLSFSGETGEALAAAYIVLIVLALLGVVAARGVMWIACSLVAIAWATLFAGNTIWLAQWSSLQWWDWLNIGGWLIVAAHLSVMAPSRMRSAGSKQPEAAALRSR